MVGRTPTAARQLASRARRRVEGADIPATDTDPTRQRAVVDAFFLAAREGDFDVVLRTDMGVRRASASRVIHGAVARPAALLRRNGG